MSQQLRKEVLKAFKLLHRTRKFVFEGDDRALAEARNQINDNFRKNQQITDETEIQKLIKVANDVDSELKTNVIQAVEKEPGVYKARITEHTTRLDNVMFDPNAVIEKPRRKRSGGGGGCCGGSGPSVDIDSAKSQTK